MFDEIAYRNPLVSGLLGLLLVGAFAADATAQHQGLIRTIPGPFQEVPLAPAAGPHDRESDHATVAMNRRRDIVVAFHSSRPDVLGQGNMKQVEVALYTWQGDDYWDHAGTIVLGSIDHDPLGLGVPQVKCERPDVVAVDNRFFVVWTRRYQGAGFEREPAVLESAWLEIDGGGAVTVQNGGLPSGMGFPLDGHDATHGLHDFWVRDCAGVPDAVALTNQMGTDRHEVAVLYPHQTSFPQDAAGARAFELRAVTASLDAQGVVTRGTIHRLHDAIPFDGPMSPDLSVVPGLILPDAVPSPEQDAFWLAFEWQTMEAGSEHGRVQVEYWQRLSGAWVRHDSVGFRSLPMPFFKSRLRRRPNLAAQPAPGTRPQAFLAFNKVNPAPQPGEDGSVNVVLSRLLFDGNGITTTLDQDPLWPNHPDHDDGKPVPMVTRPGSGLPSCFAGRASRIGQGRDVISEDGTAMDTGVHAMVARPAAAYRFHPESNRPDYVVLTLEKRLVPGSPLRVWVGVH